MFSKTTASLFLFVICCFLRPLVAQNLIQLDTDSVYLFTDDRDHVLYKAVSIDGTDWMAEALRYKIAGSLCYDNKPKNCEKYGRLYKWDDLQYVCPRGWRIPSNADWDELISYFGGEAKAAEFLMDRDLSGFDLTYGLPLNMYGRYGDNETEIHFWSASEYNEETAYEYYIIKGRFLYLSKIYSSKNYKMNCLCVK